MNLDLFLPLAVLAGLAVAAFAVPVLLARWRCTAPRRVRWALDFLFVLPLVVPHFLLTLFLQGSRSEWLRTLDFDGLVTAAASGKVKTEIDLKAIVVGPQRFAEAIYRHGLERSALLEIALMLTLTYFLAWLGFRKVQPEWVDAARMQGLGPCGRFWRVWVPTAKGWLLAALLLEAWHGLTAWFVLWSY